MTRLDPGLRNFENVDAFFDRSPFATDVTLSSGVAVRGIFDADSVEGDGLGGPRVTLASRHVREQSITHGDLLTIDEGTYRVEGLQPDGTGVHLIILVKTS